MIFCLPEIGDIEYFKIINKRKEEKKLENNFLFHTKPGQLYPIIQKSDIFVRPTNTDGYGVSLAEAIHFNIPAVASDVCPRAEGTILFKNRNFDDFTLKVKYVLQNYERLKIGLEEIKPPDYAKEILRIYTKTLKN